MNARPTVASLSLRIDAQDAKLDAILAALSPQAPAAVVPSPLHPVWVPEVEAAPVRTTKVLNRTNLRAFKATRKGKAYAGVSCADILEGRAAMPAGFHAPTGARKAAIQAWKAAQEG